ncbi:protein lchn-like [Lentinula edodes]|uniref:Protein lchn-like n=1 Tax=Lentinula edodes TaxID=5353 RepID=A0A1Q3EJR0_LENED|nr:protein lchn-like [Lentinula edodes]
MGDLVAIFHASFHPTRGNVIDWSVTASGDFNLDNLEFSALPSGLHLVEQDIVYFSKDGHQGVCAFRRVKSTEDGHRGFRLSSLGVLLAKSTRPKPWRHVAALKDLMVMLYVRMELTETLQPSETDWQPSRMYFESHEVKSVDLGGAGDWSGWSHELDGENRDRSNMNPTLHLPHLLRILGPSTLTLYKHIIGRKRTLIYTLPPVEAACILCHVAADFCYEQQVDATSNRLPGKNKEGIQVLGMITLSDIDRLQAESKSGRGWIACTTDALFLERPSYYDLLIDLTTSTPNKATRPTFYSSQPILPTSRGPTHRLSTVRFAWSDVKLWNELDRILQLDSSNSHSSNFSCCTPGFSDVSDQKLGLITAWTDSLDRLLER